VITRDPNGWSLGVSEIRDPVEGLYCILDQQNKVAHRFATPAAPTPMEVTRPPAQVGTASPRAQSDGVHPDTSSEKLGGQMMEGVMVEGERLTTTYPVGAQGNDRPIVTTFEARRSKELNTDVIRKISDPRSGEETFKLTKIERTEPDPALFQIPPDYTIMDEKGSFVMTVTRHSL